MQKYASSDSDSFCFFLFLGGSSDSLQDTCTDFYEQYVKWRCFVHWCAFSGSLKQNFTFRPHFPPKMEILGQVFGGVVLESESPEVLVLAQSLNLSSEGDSDSGPYLSHLDFCVILLQSILQVKLCLYTIVHLLLAEFKNFSSRP